MVRVAHLESEMMGSMLNLRLAPSRNRPEKLAPTKELVPRLTFNVAILVERLVASFEKHATHRRLMNALERRIPLQHALVVAPELV